MSGAGGSLSPRSVSLTPRRRPVRALLLPPLPRGRPAGAFHREPLWYVTQSRALALHHRSRLPTPAICIRLSGRRAVARVCPARIRRNTGPAVHGGVARAASDGALRPRPGGRVIGAFVF